MQASNNSYHAQGGTYCFDGSKARKGYALNKMCFSFNSVENRKRFKAFPEAYCDRFGLSREQVHAVTDLDFTRLLELGGNPYYLAKLAAIYGMSMEELINTGGYSPCEHNAVNQVVMKCPYCNHSVIRDS